MATSHSALRRVAWRSTAAHKLRLALTVLSVVLGTAFISGAFVFTASLDKAFKGAVSTAFDGIDVVVSAPPSKPGALTRDVEKQLADFPGVRALNIGEPTSSITVTGSDGKPIQTNGVPSMGLPYYPPEKSVNHVVTITEGSAPSRPGEVVINNATAKLGNLRIGDEMKVVTSLKQATVHVVGIAETSGDNTGWLSTFFTEEQWRDLYTGAGDGPSTGAGSGPSTGKSLKMVTLAAKDRGAGGEGGATALRDAIAKEFPELKVEAGEDLANKASERISTALSFVNYFLVSFGLIGLLVGTFIISNTFSMLVAQRTKEFALLRALGASRRQLTVSVLFEAFLVGLVGSALGVVAGFGISELLYRILSSIGIDMPGGGLSITTTAVVVPLVVGIIITILAAWAPAARAGAVPPVEAMRSGDQTTDTRLSGRTWAGAILAAAALALIMWAIQWHEANTGPRAIFVGVGAVAAIAAVWLAGPALSLPLVGSLGRIVGAPFGAVGKLAATNSRRNPRRTATTSFALTLGLALVACIGMLGASMKAAVSEWTETNLSADYVLSPPLTSHVALPKGVAEKAAQVDGVTDTATLALGPLLVASQQELPSLADAANADSSFGPPSGNASFFDGDVGKWYGTRAISGSLDLGDSSSEIVVNETTANKRGWRVGTEVLLVGKGGASPMKVTGIFADTADPNQAIIVSIPAVERAGAGADQLIPMQAYVDVTATDSAGVEAMRGPISDAVADYLVVQVMTAKEYGSVASSSIDVMLGIVYALLALAVVTSILGIINTLALSVVERRQEIGMLRAIGLQRGAIRRMIRLESLQISVFGALIGVGLGLGLGWALLTVLEKEGLGTIAVPWGQIGAMLVGSAVVGIIAALAPGQRAAKTPPLAAIADE
nr:ABC transporter permease [Corynebacterium lactis]